jgi:translation elongation factor EF-G
MQANAQQLPKIAFINKMDRLGASVSHSIRTIKERLKSDALILQ